MESRGVIGIRQGILFSLVLLSVEGRFYFILLILKNKKERKTKMKKTLSVLLAVIMILCIVSCNKVDKTGAWENATYRRDKEFGDGAKTVQVEVKADDQSVTFTIHTDKETLGDALLEHNLISGEEGAYGLYVKFVNGIEADYDKDQTYWAFYKNGEYMMSGVDTTVISDGEHYELVKEK